ncbi:hypothetical protein SPBR_03916 [Sporothrix brasiliensis 5110]|uniref:Carboxylesterase type B domain-containing protein n=1 Tax=Sporothrix brasiliensis 5110 TaxID=1398154 RepID=A0A0C2J1Q8_9PEZI|nr:uncharacterized protein SPBR_03916 [Sporothrix brasiliensis 5110]KIH95246.1 hypothetical protein SPBR_03916 [Sporothrix brasiliensis 5110]
MGSPSIHLEHASWLSWAFLSVAFTGAIAARCLQRHRQTRIRQSSGAMAPHTASGKPAAADLAGRAPPCVRLPQGTYEGRVVAVGQNVVESAGLGLGVGAGPGASPSSSSSSSGEPLPIPQQAALPKALDVFLGIPYAKSTAGGNRFRAPEPVVVDARGTGDRHSRVIPATQLGQRCPGVAPNPFVPEGEDCLNANVYRPSLAGQTAGQTTGQTTGQGTRIPAGPLPVVVYVHGGAFNNGMGVERDMASFVAYAERDVVGVSFNYRVGALGFLGWQTAAEDGKDGKDGDSADDSSAPLNLGLRDQQLLFSWVQNNIRCFGGDPNNVTIMGLSAGAHSIGHHILHYPPGKAPFHKAILESGAPTARSLWSPDHPRPRAQLRAFLVAAGAQEHRDILAYLRGLPLSTIVAASRTVWNDYAASVCWPFQPVVDGHVIRQTPLRAWQAGFAPRIPVMTGFNTNEGTLFVPGDAGRADTDADFRTFFADLVPGLTSDDLDELARVYPDPVTHPETSPYVMPEPYPPGVTGRQWARLEAAYAHYAYICPVLQTAHYLSTNPANSNVYLYEYAARALHWNTANHGDNQSCVAHSMAVLRGHPGLLAVADAMHGAWVRFAASPVGNPNGDGEQGAAGAAAVPWAPFVSPFSRASGDGKGLLMVFGQGNDERVPPEQRTGGPEAKPGTAAALRSLSDYELAQCRFWWDRTALSEGDGQRDRLDTKRGAVQSHL